MRRLLGFLALLLLAIVTIGADQDFRLPGASGGSLTPASLAKGDTILVVWASWSPSCRDLPERIAKLERQWAGKARIVTVNFQEDKRIVTDYLAKSPLAAPTYLDGDGRFAKAHAVTTLPGLLVFRDGRQVLKGKLGPDSPRAISKALAH